VSPRINRVFSCPEESGQFPDITDCKKYYDCSNSKAIRNNCRIENTYWDTEKKKCEPLDTNKCDPQNPFRCPLPDGIFVDLTCCDRFYSCYKNKFSLHKCPDGLHFNVEDETCDWPQYANCELQPDPKICINANESYFDERNCNCYFECDDQFRPKPMCCEDGMLWNEWEKMCDEPIFVDCFNSRKLY
jgi:hypothetical protein